MADPDRVCSRFQFYVDGRSGSCQPNSPQFLPTLGEIPAANGQCQSSGLRVSVPEASFFEVSPFFLGVVHGCGQQDLGQVSGLPVT